MLKATNTTPARVDELIVTDPVDDANSPFASVNIARIVISEPAGERVQGTITLRYAGGTTDTFTPAQAEALSEFDLRNVVGLTARWSGRIDQNAVATIRLDTRLRETVRGTTDRVLTGSIFRNVGMATVSDLIDYDQEIYPKVTASHRDDAILNTVGEQITVDVTKTITPDAQREPDRGPVTVALTGQPTGPSRSDELHITDTDATFFNAFDFTGFQPVAFTSPIDKVRVDVLTGGTFSVVGGTVEVTDAVWVHGTPITADNATPTLPAGVSADQVRGVRYVFTKQDGSIMENPANPVQRATFTVTRRTTLRTGGAVPSTMQGQVAAPGEAAPGVFANTVTADTWGPSIGGGDRLHADKEATDDVTYQHALNKVTVKKSTPSTTASADAPSLTP
ncbi:hypothetical protein BW730_09665 [Tessaracoccus aquimaris]|uniref:Uncharacterized protein n=1 Tax=Tessaracoccus aquimaris TaxID=1332264 RepID=A0A1Q2CNM9_9ACTN|nr:hypothetical protein [Tessaracoccus aquimaris]AQP47716.1 hypothetical protein BW730_09665 [Tessaracoccus aquimaris]